MSPAQTRRWSNSSAHMSKPAWRQARAKFQQCDEADIELAMTRVWRCGIKRPSLPSRPCTFQIVMQMREFIVDPAWLRNRCAPATWRRQTRQCNAGREMGTFGVFPLIHDACSFRPVRNPKKSAARLVDHNDAHTTHPRGVVLAANDGVAERSLHSDSALHRSAVIHTRHANGQAARARHADVRSSRHVARSARISPNRALAICTIP
jgi:hypothetical protein